MSTMDLVYNRSSETDDLVVFADRRLAETVSAVRKALDQAQTWGEFASMIPDKEWGEILESLEDLPDADSAFDPDDILGHADGDYPTWLTGAMAEFLPDDLVAEYGTSAGSVLNGDAVELPWDKADAIADDLRRRGHQVELRTDLDLA